MAGERSRTMIYTIFERKYQASHEKVPERIRGFHTTLKTIFGAPATGILEKKIARNLHG